MLKLRPHHVAIFAAPALLMGAPSHALAQNNQSCSLLILEDGTLAPNVGNTTLSSKNQRGRAAEVRVSATNSSYSIYIDKPLGFVVAPPGGNDNMQLSVTYSGRGKTDFLEKPSNESTRIKRGDTDLKIDLTATRFAGAFPGGDYRAGVTVRCE
ncbi:MAG: hypothetical protein AAFY99_12910 [Pseudomonadota bacterium]